MRVKAFDPSLIEIRSNPFSSTRSESIIDGIYMKDLLSCSTSYIASTNQYIKIGILSKLLDKVTNIERSKNPNHIFVVAEYGQGKSCSLRKVQDLIYIQFNGAIISYSIGSYNRRIENDEHYLQKKVMEDLESLFTNIDPALYTIKSAVETKYQLNTEKTFNQFLEAYDKAFCELNILVYIFIDELDKIVISDIDEQKIRTFLEDLKLIGDKCSQSISLMIAGTPNCQVAIDSFSIDYKQRFDLIENNYLTQEQTKKFIQSKCSLRLQYVGHYPFVNRVIDKIYQATNGNIRRIEALCRDLWIYSSQQRRKIDSATFSIYMKEQLAEPIKNALGFRTTDNIINFIADLYINNDKLSLQRISKLPQSRKREIEQFISANNNIAKPVVRSIVLNREFKERINNNFIH